jgi:hypothetical protein
VSARKSTQEPARRPGEAVLPYDWQAKRPTEDTNAACDAVLRDSGRGRR